MFQSGDIIDSRYRVVRELGRGGYGTVFLAEELHPPGLLDRDLPAPTEPLRRVALKVFSQVNADDRRFAVEIAALCRLDHPHIVPVFTHGRDRYPWIATRFIDGFSLAEVDRVQSSFTLAQRVGQLVKVAEALAHAHEHGVIHRDLKPHNVLVDRDGHAWVVDFGLAWLHSADESASRRVGTPGYLAPELIEPCEYTPDHRADIYSLGAMIHASFAGTSPFRGEGMMHTIKRQLSGDPKLSAELPPALRELVLRCLEVNPERRPRTAWEVADALRQILQRDAVPAPDLHAIAERPTPDARIDLLFLRVESIEATMHPERGEGLRMTLNTGLSGEEIGAFIWFDDRAHRAELNYASLRQIRAGMRLHLLGARVVENSRGQRFVALDARTTPVLEPEIPIAVTDVAKLQGVKSGPCARRVLVDWHEPRPFTSHIVEGGIAHDILETLIQRDDALDDRSAFAHAFVDGLRRRKLECVAAGMRDEDLAALQERLALHFRNIAAWLRDVPPTARAAEVQRICARYGMEGRSDVVLRNDDAIDIVELKTGKYVSDEHEQQVRAYGLMWERSARQERQRLRAALIYSRTGTHRQVNLEAQDRDRALLHGRNQLIGALWEIARSEPSNPDPRAHRPPRTPRFGEKPALCADTPCRFRRDGCSAMHSHCHDPVARGSTPTAQIWFEHFDQLITREYLAVSRQIGSLLAPGSIDERVGEGRALRDAEITLVDERSQRVHLQSDAADIFQAGDAALLHREESDDGAFHVKVLAVDGAHIELSCHGASSLHQLPQRGWALDHRPLRIGFQDAWRGIYNVLRAERDDVMGWLLRPAAATPATSLPALPPTIGETLNDEQRAAVAQVLAPIPASVVQGPPGTGKTAVIAEAVAQLVREGKRVLVATHTHSAADNVLTRIAARGVRSILRVGGPPLRDPLLLDACKKTGIDPEELHLDTLAANAPALSAIHRAVHETSVFIATANAALRGAAFEILEQSNGKRAAGVSPIFDVIIVDEASQLIEPLAAGLAVRASRIVLVGDDRQLPPVVCADDARSCDQLEVPPTLQPLGIGGLDTSLLDRLRGRVPTVTLRRQYRMSEAIQSFPNLSFYDGALVAARGNAPLALAPSTLEALDPELQRRLDPARPNVWVDVGEYGDGRVNTTEADEIARTVRALLNAMTRSGLPLTSERVGVITPYRAQSRAIRARLQATLGAHAQLVEVDTVERFQGREKDVILLSLTTRRWSNFVFDPRRLNVALTRARFKVLVFGPTALGQRMMERFIPSERQRTDNPPPTRTDDELVRYTDRDEDDPPPLELRGDDGEAIA